MAGVPNRRYGDLPSLPDPRSVRNKNRNRKPARSPQRGVQQNPQRDMRNASQHPASPAVPPRGVHPSRQQQNPPTNAPTPASMPQKIAPAKTTVEKTQRAKTPQKQTLRDVVQVQKVPQKQDSPKQNVDRSAKNDTPRKNPSTTGKHRKENTLPPAGVVETSVDKVTTPTRTGTTASKDISKKQSTVAKSSQSVEQHPEPPKKQDTAAKPPQKPQDPPTPKTEESVDVPEIVSKKQSSGTTAPTLTPVPTTTLDKKKKRVFRTVMLSWLSLLLVAGSVLGAYGYKVWIDASTEKLTNHAYEQGAADAQSVPTIETALRLTTDELSALIVASPTASFPTNPVLSRYTLDGWSTPGGNETYGRVRVSMCYTGDGVSEPKKSSAYLISQNAQAEKPQWSVDSVSITGDNCTIGEN